VLHDIQGESAEDTAAKQIASFQMIVEMMDIRIGDMNANLDRERLSPPERELMESYLTAMRRVNLALARAFAPPGQFTDNAWEQLRSQQANAAYRLEQIALEMERVRRVGDAARDIPRQEEAARVQKVNVPDHEKEQNARALAEGEQQQDTERLTRERHDKETLGRAERERLEALEREKGASEERADRAWHPSIAHDMESEYQYVRDQIH
jgi:hypothetical protein